MKAKVRIAALFTTSASLVVMVVLLLTLAAPAAASEGCPNEARREEQGAAARALPDCRAYELVTQPYQPSPRRGGEFLEASFLGTAEESLPPNPNALPMTNETDFIAQNGNAVAFSSGGEPNSESNAFSTNLSRRGQNGWVGENLIPPTVRHGFLCFPAGYSGFSANFEKVTINMGLSDRGEAGIQDCGQPEPPIDPRESDESGNLFLRDTNTKSFQLINLPPEGSKSYDPQVVGLSADGDHVVFVSRAQLTSDAPNGELNLQPGPGAVVEGHCPSPFGNTYLWSSGAVRLPTVLPDGTATRGYVAGSTALYTGCYWEASRNYAFTHSISADGERILFYAGGGWSIGKSAPAWTAPHVDGGLYLRQNAAQAQSALAHGGALGIGTLAAGSSHITSLRAATATATGHIAAGSNRLIALEITIGGFLVGQPISGEGIPAGTTITACTPDCTAPAELTLSNNATESNSERFVSTSPGPAPFAVGQTITAKGIPAATTITAVKPGELELSQVATAAGTAVSLESSSPCTEADHACTVQIDIPEAGASGQPGDGQFKWADAETTKIFFTDVEKLTADSTATFDKPDLYEYDTEKPAGQRLTDLTVNAAEPADVLGFSGASEDGSYVYFVAQAPLSGAQPNSHGAIALPPAEGAGTLTEGSTEVTGVSTTSGAFHEGMEIGGEGIPAHTWITAVGSGALTLSSTATASGTKTLSATAANLYLRHAGATTFIANLSVDGGDRCDWTTICMSSRVSQNGQFIAFDSFDRLTGYDNRPLRPTACEHITNISESPCIEAYRYAVTGGELTCATCNPTGARPAAEVAWAAIEMASHPGHPLQGTSALSNAVSNDGEVYFDSMEKLVPADENETWDVYEYSGGEGPSAQLHLISSGKSELPSDFLGATPDGSNVFFFTFQSLLRADTRTDADIYDARSGGGFAEPLIPACEAEGCRPAYPGAPGGSSPASASLEGKGNVHPPAGKGISHPAVKCKKGVRHECKKKAKAKHKSARKAARRKSRRS